MIQPYSHMPAAAAAAPHSSPSASARSMLSSLATLSLTSSSSSSSSSSTALPAPLQGAAVNTMRFDAMRLAEVDIFQALMGQTAATTSTATVPTPLFPNAIARLIAGYAPAAYVDAFPTQARAMLEQTIDALKKLQAPSSGAPSSPRYRNANMRLAYNADAWEEMLYHTHSTYLTEARGAAIHRAHSDQLAFLLDVYVRHEVHHRLYGTGTGTGIDSKQQTRANLLELIVQELLANNCAKLFACRPEDLILILESIKTHPPHPDGQPFGDQLRTECYNWLQTKSQHIIASWPPTLLVRLTMATSTPLSLPPPELAACLAQGAHYTCLQQLARAFDQNDIMTLFTLASRSHIPKLLDLCLEQFGSLSWAHRLSYLPLASLGQIAHACTQQGRHAVHRDFLDRIYRYRGLVDRIYSILNVWPVEPPADNPLLYDQQLVSHFTEAFAVYPPHDSVRRKVEAWQHALTSARL